MYNDLLNYHVQVAWNYLSNYSTYHAFAVKGYGTHFPQI